MASTPATESATPSDSGQETGQQSDVRTAAPSAPTRMARVRAPLLSAAFIGAATLALHLRDPHQSGSWGLCPLYALTGIYCPGCGGLRAVNDLTHGDLSAALSSNLLFVLTIPLLAWLWLGWLGRSWRGGPADPHGPHLARRIAGVDHRVLLGLAAFLVLISFTVLRNTAAGAWLAP